jgi:hypothetical protein
MGWRSKKSTEIVTSSPCVTFGSSREKSSPKAMAQALCFNLRIQIKAGQDLCIGQDA